MSRNNYFRQQKTGGTAVTQFLLFFISQMSYELVFRYFFGDIPAFSVKNLVNTA